MTKSKGILKRYTPEEDNFIKENYHSLSLREMGEKLDRKFGSIAGRMRLLGLKFSKEQISKHISDAAKNSTVANTGRFKKGAVSWNMNKKGYMGANRTSFKKGHAPHNHRPVGSERVSIYGYVEVKTEEPNKWEFKHRIVWQQQHGTIAKGCNVQFKDGNRQNCSIENLYIITRNEQVLQNSIIRYPPEMRTAFHTIGKLNRLIKQQAQ